MAKKRETVKAPKKATHKKIQFLKSPTGRPFYMAYSVGSIANLEIDKAEELIKAKIAKAV